jgi:DNA-binding NarL/FixJ family response regulator
MDLFKDSEDAAVAAHAPLAVQMRPRTIDEVLGQQEFLGPGRMLRRMLEADRLSSLVFHGPPGTGKTTLATVIAAHASADFHMLNAVRASVHDVRRIADHARALLAASGDAEGLFHGALQSGMSAGPFLWARVQLAYGEWLHQQRRDAAARTPLRAAIEVFDALGVIPWSERARQQLRATGEKSQSRIPAARDQLTPQELQIAQMAADGLTNREIGQKLFLSHRTISSHLYRVFPKLGVASRAELLEVLEREIPAASSSWGRSGGDSVR